MLGIGGVGCVVGGRGGIAGVSGKVGGLLGTEMLAGALSTACGTGLGDGAAFDGAAARGAAKSLPITPDDPMAITPPQTEHRARIPAAGILAGSTRKTELHSEHETFISSPLAVYDSYRLTSAVAASSDGS
jgi:hypothetical protein